MTSRPLPSVRVAVAASPPSETPGTSAWSTSPNGTSTGSSSISSKTPRASPWSTRPPPCSARTTPTPNAKRYLVGIDPLSDGVHSVGIVCAPLGIPAGRYVVVEWLREEAERDRGRTGSGAESDQDRPFRHLGRYRGGVESTERAAIEAIVSKLDDKSKLLSPEEFEQMTVTVDGDLVGVGVAIDLDGDQLEAVLDCRRGRWLLN